MNIKCSALIIFILSTLIFITYPTLVCSETAQKSGSNTGTSGHIETGPSGTFDLDSQNNIAVWAGDVIATWDNLTIKCKRLEIYYNNIPKKDKNDKIQGSIDRIIAIEDVEITRPDGSSATTEKAVYYYADDKVVLTGNPVLKYGDDKIKGPTITINLKDGSAKVEGGASADIYPPKK